MIVKVIIIIFTLIASYMSLTIIAIANLGEWYTSIMVIMLGIITIVGVVGVIRSRSNHELR